MDLQSRTMNQRAEETKDLGIALYNPKGAPAIIFFLLFLAVAIGLWTRYFRMKPRAKWMLPATLGTLLMSIGFLVRYTRRNGLNAWSFLFETILILATPCAFLAQDYALLPRLSRHLEADDCLVIPRTWIVKFFVSSDVLTFVAQLAGTALTVVGAFIEEYANIGRIVLLVALIVQAICFCGFIIVFAIFAKRLRHREQHVDKWHRPSVYILGTSWKHNWTILIKMISLQCFLIAVRSLYRIVEYAAGSNSKIANQEVWFYIFDSLPLLVVVAMFVVIWPPHCLDENARHIICEPIYPMLSRNQCT
ncbi:hypothetical protein NliqN6_1448 [Naganishia liquefaciens]|uniref:RTA1-domain-containing protein n=1 Tax=Naganishia liquefaciens TaxID=104408 RepID=A0A8H3YET4_9TREE|nr:hypothetical protein NliqN6_1448 [Naganishia liquefaciens]